MSDDSFFFLSSSAPPACGLEKFSFSPPSFFSGSVKEKHSPSPSFPHMWYLFFYGRRTCWACSYDFFFLECPKYYFLLLSPGGISNTSFLVLSAVGGVFSSSLPIELGDLFFLM